eukprot:10548489-Alexandrium_andersonii.AAC.1
MLGACRVLKSGGTSSTRALVSGVCNVGRKRTTTGMGGPSPEGGEAAMVGSPGRILGLKAAPSQHQTRSDSET